MTDKALLCPRCNGLSVRSVYLPDGSPALRCEECRKEFQVEEAKLYQARSVWLLNPEIR